MPRSLRASCPCVIPSTQPPPHQSLQPPHNLVSPHHHPSLSTHRAARVTGTACLATWPASWISPTSPSPSTSTWRCAYRCGAGVGLWWGGVGQGRGVCGEVRRGGAGRCGARRLPGRASPSTRLGLVWLAARAPSPNDGFGPACASGDVISAPSLCCASQLPPSCPPSLSPSLSCFLPSYPSRQVAGLGLPKYLSSGEHWLDLGEPRQEGGRARVCVSLIPQMTDRSQRYAVGT